MNKQTVLSAFLRKDEGVAAIEFGFIAGFLVLLLVGVADVSQLALTSMRVRYAAEAGATYAAMKGSDVANDPVVIAAATAATSAAVSTWASSGWRTESSIRYGCATQTGINETSQTASCNTNAGGAPSPSGKYVTVRTKVNFQPLFEFGAITYPKEILHTLEVRVK